MFFTKICSETSNFAFGKIVDKFNTISHGIAVFFVLKLIEFALTSIIITKSDVAGASFRIFKRILLCWIRSTVKCNWFLVLKTTILKQVKKLQSVNNLIIITISWENRIFVATRVGFSLGLDLRKSKKRPLGSCPFSIISSEFTEIFNFKISNLFKKQSGMPVYLNKEMVIWRHHQ